MHAERPSPADAPPRMLIPLTTAQRDVWFGQMLAPDSPCYSISRYVEIFGSIDPVLFEKALRQVVSEIEGLHIVVTDTKDGLGQYFRPPAHFSIPFIDVSGRADAHAAAVAWMRDETARVFDLTHGSLFRYALFKVADDRFYWYEIYHHIIIDGFGFSLLERRVAEHYRALLDSKSPPIAEPLSVLDLLDEEEVYRGSAQRARDRHYWLTKCVELPEALTLSGRRPSWPDAFLASEGSIPRSIIQKLEALGVAHRASLAAVVTAIAAVYISRMTGSRDVILGMPVAARTDAKMRRIVGLTSNVVPLRLFVDLGAPFENLLEQTGKSMRAALRHQRYWASALRKDLGLTPGQPNIYGTLINFMPTDEDMGFAGWPIRKHNLANSPIEDLSIWFHVGKPDADIGLELKANKANYNSQALDRHRQNFLHLIAVIASDPVQKIGQFAILASSERNQVLHEWNAPDATMPDKQCLPDLFEAEVARAPAGTALVFGDLSLTYDEVNRRANRLAHHLIAKGVGPECLVGLCVERSFDMVIGVLAILKAGGAYLPLDPAYPAARLDFMLQDARPVLLLVNAETDRELQANIPHLVFDATGGPTDLVGGGDANPTNAARHNALAPDHPAYVIYTSGSTGTPKGVVLTHSGIAVLAATQTERLGVTASSRVLQFASLNFDASLWELVMALTHGAALVLRPPDALSGVALRVLLVEQRITHLTLPPAVLATIEEGEDLSLGCLVVAGDVCPAPLIALWAGRLRMINAYGPSESTVCTTMSAPLDGTSAPIGRPICGTRVYVLDAALEPVPIGCTGELYIAGVGLARGYLNQPALTAERFVADPYGAPGSRMYRSGDLARWQADGALDFLGRIDQQMKIRGIRIEPGEIEAVLAEDPAIGQAVVIAREDAAGDKRLVAYLVPSRTTRAPINLKTLRQRLAARLPDYMLPSVFVVLDVLPLTPNGKLDRKAFPVGDDFDLAADYLAPVTREEVLLCDCVAELLGRDQVGLTDNFFEIGGHSLVATRLANQIRTRLGRELPIRTIFDTPVLGDLARVLTTLPQSAEETAPLESRVTASDMSVPLSYSQERMWLIQSLSPKNTAYNIAFGFQIRGALDIKAISSAVDVLFQRHEVLRCSIRLVDGRPLQDIQPFVGDYLSFIDLRGNSEPQVEALRLAEADAGTVFDLARGPVIRMNLFQTSAETFLLSVNFHHIAGDQWSIGVLGRELAAVYNDHRRGRPSRLEPLSVCYRDYAMWQRNDVFQVEFERQLSFWRKQLADLPSLELSTDHQRPQLQSLKGSFCLIPIEASLLQSLERLGQQSGSTLFMIMLSAFAVLLHRNTGQEDIPIGVPVANRSRSATEVLIGTFVNTLVMRMDLSANPEFYQFLQRVRATVLDAFAHPDVPFERLVQDCVQRRDTSRAPLVQVLFNVANAPMDGILFDGFDWEPVLLNRNGAQFDLSVSIELSLTRSVIVEYDTDLFDRSTIERLIGQYFAILEGAAAAPTTSLRALRLLSAEQLATLNGWNETSAPYPKGKTFSRIFEDRVAQAPDATAIAFEGAALTYAELNARANAVARSLRERGVGPGEFVGLYVNRSVAMLVALLGIQKSGGAYVPLDPHFPGERIEYMLSDSGAKVLVIAGALAKKLELPEGTKILDLDAELLESASIANPNEDTAPEEIAYLIYTSGSTGRPKGVAISHDALLNFLWSMQQRLALTATDVLAAVTTISFDIAALELYLPLMIGARIELISRETAIDGRALSRLLDSNGTSVLQATPATWRMLLESDWKGRKGFCALSGGEPLPRDLADAILVHVDELWNLYGPTETTVWSTAARVEPDALAISIGWPLANTQIHILDSAGELLPIGNIGEICIGGAGVAIGYHGQATLTAERFIPDRFSGEPGARLYRSGDLGRWGADGKLYHLGRSDNQVKIRGFRIELSEIETVLRSHPAINDSIVIAVQAEQGDQRLVAYVVFAKREDLTVSEVRLYLRRQLPDFMIPSIITAIDSVPMTPNGKLDRNALPNPFKNAVRAVTNSDSPAHGMEQVIAEIWRSVLKIDRIGAGDNFFELGGHSLLSLRVAVEVEKRTGFRMDPRILFFKDLRQVASQAEFELSAIGIDHR